MPIRLVKPEGMTFHPAGSGCPMPDGTQLFADRNGQWWLSEKWEYLLSAFIDRGWKVYQEPKPKRIFKDQFEQAAIEKPLSIPEILTLCESEQVKVRIFNGELEIRPLRGDLSRGLLAHLEVRRAELRNYLERQNNIPWRKV
jgi:hypothetical protein